jgi:hypothetical protein
MVPHQEIGLQSPASIRGRLRIVAKNARAALALSSKDRG